MSVLFHEVNKIKKKVVVNLIAEGRPPIGMVIVRVQGGKDNFLC